MTDIALEDIKDPAVAKDLRDGLYTFALQKIRNQSSTHTSPFGPRVAEFLRRGWIACEPTPIPPTLQNFSTSDPKTAREEFARAMRVHKRLRPRRYYLTMKGRDAFTSLSTIIGDRFGRR